MKSFWITIRLGRSEIENSEIDETAQESWLQDELQQYTSLMEGHGQVRIERVDPLRVDAELNFTVAGASVSDVMERFKDDFRKLTNLAQGIEIAETKNYKLWFPRINGEQFPVFVRIDPDSGRPIYTED